MEITTVNETTHVLDTEDNCPECGAILNAFSNTKDTKVPQVGDLTICCECTAYLVITDDFTLRTLTVDELIDLPNELLLHLTSARAALKRAHDIGTLHDSR